MNPLFAGSLLEIIKDALDRILPDPEAKAKAQAEAFELLTNGTFDDKAKQAIAIAQADINKADAQSGNWFQSGWRPAIGWTCAGALFSQYIVKPWVQWACIVAGHPLPPLPGIDDNLWQLMGGMLGLGAMRSFDKLKGTAA